MANANGWGDGASNNNIGWGQGANNAIGWGDSHANSWAGLTDIVGITTPPVDPDAQAFITAAAITDPTQQSAINTLVTDLKGYSIWTKFKAIYPIVGGTAASHKWNLKDPRDLDAAFRLTFATGVTHSANGMVSNGTSGYADTFLNSFTNTSQNSTHYSYYSRTNSNAEVELGALSGGLQCFLILRSADLSYFVVNQSAPYTTYSNSDAKGFYVANRTASNIVNGWKNGVKVATSSNSSTGNPNLKLFLLAYNNGGTAAAFSVKQCAFASIGDGLTDAEAANFYTAVQAYQTTLGRSIGTQTVSDADAQAFVNAANIDDQVQANAINDLVIGMKADGIWTKMKAIYPVVGGNATAHAVNLKTPGTFNLTFATGWTHSSTGMTPTNSFADTFLTPLTSLGLDNAHISYYSRTNVVGQLQIDMGSIDGSGQIYAIFNYNTQRFVAINNSGFLVPLLANTTGLLIENRRNSTQIQSYKSGSLVNTASIGSVILGNRKIYLGAANNAGSPLGNSTKECAFASIGDGLTDTEATNYYNRVQAYQTTLNRNV